MRDKSVKSGSLTREYFCPACNNDYVGIYCMQNLHTFFISQSLQDVVPLFYYS